MGERWDIEEDKILLKELEDNIDKNEIAKSHNRTLDGIIGRQKGIAYNMYLEAATEEEIIRVTKLSIKQIHDTIAKKGKGNSKEKTTIEEEVILLKEEIKDLKNTVKELVVMMKAIYEFEDT